MAQEVIFLQRRGLLSSLGLFHTVDPYPALRLQDTFSRMHFVN